MRFATLLFLFGITLFLSCSKSKNEKITGGTYSGLVLSLRPLPSPYDSVAAVITLTFSDNHYSGSSDTAKSIMVPFIPGGTYQADGSHIKFTPDPYPMVSQRSIMSGEYSLLKTGDSLVFALIPDSKLVGTGPTYYRLKLN